MAKAPSPLLGYNTNVRHKGRVFHIQTEDSGVQHPHVITHLFADGGRILKSTKTPYADKLDLPDMAAQVKKIMQDQHKAMFIALRDGQFDHLIDPAAADARLADGEAGAAPKPAPPARPSATIPAVNPGAPAAIQAPGPAAMPPRPSSASATPPRSASATMPAATAPGSRPAMPAAPAPVAPAAAAAPAGAPPGAVPAAAFPPATPVRAPSVAMPAQRASIPGAPAPAAGAQPAASRSDRSGRYGSVRAPEIFGSFKQKETTSIFGDELMSEKSLDEVILAYLAEDLDEKPR